MNDMLHTSQTLWKTTLLSMDFACGLLLALTLAAGLASADPGDLYVAPGGNCGGAIPCYGNVQAAVDAAQAGDEIKVAGGTYTGVSARPVPSGYMAPPASGIIRQVVYLSKTVTLQGGYTLTNWTEPDPTLYPTILDAQGQGRVLFIEGDISPTIAGLTFTGGDDVGLGGWAQPVSMDCGGGVYVLESDILFENNVIVSNVSGDGAGIVLLDSPGTVRSNTILSNTAPYGGGLAVWRNAPRIENNTIRYNSVTVDGAGVFLIDTQAVLEGNLIADNTASGFAAGIRLRGGSPTFINNVVIDNDATYAGALFSESASSRLYHTTFARNSGRTAVHLYNNSTLVMTNTILSDANIGIEVLAGCAATVNSILWYNTQITMTHTPPVQVTFTNERTGNPLFAADGYHLTAGSAAIDVGVETGVLVDIDGQARPGGSGYDLGADEFWYMPYKYYLPSLEAND